MKLFYFDLETTGLHFWKHGIHQLSAIVEIDGVVKEEVNFKMQPYSKAKIEEEALKIGGVTKKILKSYMSFEDAYKIITYTLSKYVNKFDKNDKFHLVGYNNSGFDNAFLRAFFVQNNDKYFNSWFWIDTIDVMVLASNFFKKERHLIPDFKLGTIAKKLKVKVDESKLHDAFYDINLTKQIYKKLNN